MPMVVIDRFSAWPCAEGTGAAGAAAVRSCRSSDTPPTRGAAENRRECAWLVGIGTPLPLLLVLGLGLAGKLPLDALGGTAQQNTSVLLVLAIAVAVTSIPVISHVFYDLGIPHTRFASLILGRCEPAMKPVPGPGSRELAV